jgi:hypothetical protein
MQPMRGVLADAFGELFSIQPREMRVDQISVMSKLPLQPLLDLLTGPNGYSM